MRGWTLSLVALVAMTGLAQAQTAIKPAIVYDNGGKFDKSFNEGVFNGAEKFTDETKIAVAEFEPANEAQREQALRRFAQRGHDPIIAVGFSQAVGAGEGRQGVPQHPVRHHRQRGEAAQRAVGRVQGA